MRILRTSQRLYGLLFLAMLVSFASMGALQIAAPAFTNSLRTAGPGQRLMVIRSTANKIWNLFFSKTSISNPSRPTPASVDSASSESLRFEVNQGQMDQQIKFFSVGSGYSLFLTATETTLILGKDQSGVGFQFRTSDPYSTVMRIKLIGANPALRLESADQPFSNGNYLTGKEPSHQKAEIPTYAKVRYEGLYPGVDMIFYGNQRELEYDFVVAPTADPRSIRLTFEGANRLRLNGQGELVLNAANEEIRLHSPAIYRESGGVEHVVTGHYVLKGNHEVGLRVGD